jgi:hypothetical protein
LKKSRYISSAFSLVTNPANSVKTPLPGRLPAWRCRRRQSPALPALRGESGRRTERILTIGRSRGKSDRSYWPTAMVRRPFAGTPSFVLPVQLFRIPRSKRDRDPADREAAYLIPIDYAFSARTTYRGTGDFASLLVTLLQTDIFRMNMPYAISNRN